MTSEIVFALYYRVVFFIYRFFFFIPEDLILKNAPPPPTLLPVDREPNSNKPRRKRGIVQINGCNDRAPETRRLRLRVVEACDPC